MYATQLKTIYLCIMDSWYLFYLCFYLCFPSLSFNLIWDHEYVVHVDQIIAAIGIFACTVDVQLLNTTIHLLLAIHCEQPKF